MQIARCQCAIHTSKAISTFSLHRGITTGLPYQTEATR